MVEIRGGKAGRRSWQAPEFKLIRAFRPSDGRRRRAGFAVHY
jgi:hypothetical protein